MKRASRVRRWLLAAAILVILYTVIGFFVLPPIARSQLEKRLSAELGRRVQVERIRLNPYAFSVTLENFAIFERDGTTPFFGWRKLYVNANAWSSIWKEWSVGEIALAGFDARVAVNADQSLNFSDLLARFSPADSKPPPAATKPGRPVHIGNLRVADARIDFSDDSRAKPFSTVVGPVTFALTEFRTFSGTGAPYHFQAVTESGEKLSWAGTLHAEPPSSRGELALENIQLAKYAPYYADRIQADLVEGTLSMGGRYELNLAEKDRVAKLNNGELHLRGLKMVERSNRETFIELPGMDITGIHADAFLQKATIDLIALTSGHLRARREKDGAINLLAMLQPGRTGDPATAAAQTPPTSSAPPATPAPRPDLAVGEVALKDFRVEFLDQAAPQPVQLDLGGIQFSLRNINFADGSQLPLQLAFDWAPRGAVRVDGSVGLFPIRADLTVDVAGLEILPLSPYLEQFANARLTQGTVTTGLIVEAAIPAGEPLKASVIGGLKVENFALVDSRRNDELTGFSALTLRGLKAVTTPEIQVTLDEVDLAGPYARVLVNKDKSLNLASIVREEKPGVSAMPAETPAVAPAGTAAPMPRIEIGKVVVSDGDFQFSDRSVDPNVNLAMKQFGGTIAGLSSTNPAKANLDLKGLVGGAGPVAIAGKIDPLGASKSFDLKIDFKNVDLVPFSPYSGKFAGYELARGKLVLDVKLNVEGEKIDADNVITLNQFTFGGPVKSPDATSLPVRLGVALLKDLDGKIVIDVPVQGRMDDPSFRVGKIVLRVIVNLLTKAAVSPFALLGSAFGGGGDELAWQDFAPGSAELRTDEVKKLDTMVKALTNRPGLNVDLQGSYDPAADAHALKGTKLAAAVRRAVWEQKHATNPSIAPPAQLEITPEEEAAMIKKMYDEQFPPGTRFGAPVPPPPPMAPPPQAPTGFFARLMDSLTRRSEREEAAVQQENARRVAEHARAIETAIATGLPMETMRGRLEEATAVDENDLRALAQARAEAVRDYFVTRGKLAPERIFLTKDSALPKGARVMLGLQ